MVKAVILAAGKGTRMKSEKPKVVHMVCGKPMVYYAIEAARAAGCERVCVIVGYHAEDVREKIEETYNELGQTDMLRNQICYAEQTEQLGTGHAVACAKDFIGKDGDVLILCGDTPLVTADALARAICKHQTEGNGVTVISALLEDPYGYGRIIREGGTLERIVEQKDATEAEQAVKEVNSGMYIFKCSALVTALSELTNDNAQGEYYLPDTIARIKEMGLPVDAVPMEDVDQIKGVNTPEQLAEAEALMKRRQATFL